MLKKKTIDRVISSLRKVKNKENIIRWSILIDLNNKTIKNSKDWKNIIKKIVIENHTNFQSINSYLFIGLLKIRNIVLPSISLKRSWLQTNKTQTNQKTSIIASQKSTITLSSSQIVSFQREIENKINTKAKKSIKYKNLFLIISLKVFNAIFIIKNN